MFASLMRAIFLSCLLYFLSADIRFAVILMVLSVAVLVIIDGRWFTKCSTIYKLTYVICDGGRF